MTTREGGIEQERVLVVVDEVIAHAEDVPEEVVATLRHAAEVRLVAPTMTTRLQSLTSDIDGARSHADGRLHAVMALLRQQGVDAQGQVGDEDPLQAIDDVLCDFPADALVVAMHQRHDETWREHHLADRLRRRFDVPVTIVTVPLEAGRP